MLDFWRLDTKDNDFFLVKSPSLALASEVRAYHLELLNRVRTLQNYWEIEELVFEQIENYYSKIANLLGFRILDIDPRSRLSFFIAHEQRQDFWISGLEILMGYDFGKSQEVKEPSITSGSFELDLLAELLLLPDTKQVKWLYETKSPPELLKLIKQISDRSRGQEAINDINKQKDLDFLSNPETLSKLQQEGLGI
jgi:hypothetical protein